jgi:hypothetical protein
MANEKRHDKKDDKKATATAAPAEVAESPPGNGERESAPPVTALVKIPTSEEIEVLGRKSVEAFEGLVKLLDDTELTDDSHRRVRDLLDQANPRKPGMEEVITAWTVPHINIAQPTTQATARPESAKHGELFTDAGTVLERPYGFIPLYFHEENVNFPQGEKVPVCSAPDAKLGKPYGLCELCPYLPFGKQKNKSGKQEQTDCTNQLVVTVLSLDLSGVYLVRFAKTSHKAGRALMALAQNGPFAWKKSYLLNTEKQTGDLGVWFEYKIEPTGKDNAPEAIKIAAALSNLYAANRRKFLAEHYETVARSPLTAATIEQNVDQGKLMAALNLGGAGEEPDLDSPAPSTGGVRTAARPM